MKQELFSPKRRSVLGSLNKMLASVSLSHVFVRLAVLLSKPAILKNGLCQECGSKIVSGQRINVKISNSIRKLLSVMTKKNKQ